VQVECVSLDCRVYLKRAALESALASTEDGLSRLLE
jgi:hypothetical protein